jgi:hypothetical protein
MDQVSDAIMTFIRSLDNPLVRGDCVYAPRCHSFHRRDLHRFLRDSGRCNRVQQERTPMLPLAAASPPLAGRFSQLNRCRWNSCAGANCGSRIDLRPAQPTRLDSQLGGVE